MRKEVTFARYDTADYLKSGEDIRAYLDAVMEEGGDEPAFVARALGTVARPRNMTALAEEVGMSRTELGRALSGEGNPTLATVLKVSKALGLRVSFQPYAAGEVGGAWTCGPRANPKEVTDHGHSADQDRPRGADRPG